MFDLFRSRAKAVRIMLGALLMLVAISMVITLVPGFGTGGGGGPSDQVVAEIGGEPLTSLEVQRAIQMQIRSKQFPPEMASLYVPQIVNQLITENAVAYEAQRLGFEVTENDVAVTIQSIFPQLFQDGKFVGREVYSNYLAQQNLSIPEFESNLRKQLLLNKVRDLVLEGIVVSPDEVEAEYRRRNEKVKIEYVAISPDKYRSQVNLTPEEIKNYFKQHSSAYQIPEKRNIDVILIDEAKVGQSITIPEAELRRAYEQNKDMYRVPERVHVRHILLKTTDVPKDEIPKIRAKAEDILKQLKQGADFAELARKDSEDPGSASKGGDLGWISRGQTVKAFEDSAFSLKPGQMSNVISTEYGFHIIEVLGKEEARLKSFDEVKSQLEEERKKQAVYDRMQTLADEAHASLVKDPLSAGKIAQELGLQFVHAEKIGAGEPIPAIGPSDQLHEAVDPLKQGEVTQVFQVSPTKLAVAAVTNVYPARPAELSEVESQVREALVNEKLAKLVAERAGEALQKAKSLDGNLKSVARSMGLEFKAPPEFGRNGAAEGLGSAAYLDAAFTGEVGNVFGPVSVGGKAFICKTVEKIPADMSQFASERENLQQQLKAQKARQRNELFEEGLLNHLIEQKKVKIHQDVINRLAASYSSQSSGYPGG